ncbi:EAL domain-containing protein [Novosphingobium sp. 9]|uniref:bifunctional diguanylate cyclase/phosphodiesterase n=1 Tax=Novosphingobium sp. 9 TaxID=2025349 RepID=UPI0021B557B3|nr:EAL domain-containing protein [Novosphingobium sp. 9]
MFQVFDCVWTQHDHHVVVLAALVWIVASLAFFLALGRAQECGRERRASWLALGGLAGGLGVWATHFVGMLAYHGALPVDYDPATTVVSAAVAVAGFWAALRSTETRIVPGWLAAGTAATVAVGAMHFIGMAAVRTQGRIAYDWSAVGIAAIVSIVLFSAAFLSFARLRGVMRIAGASLASLLAICALHFTAMSATSLIYDPTLPRVPDGGSRDWLIAAVVGTTMVIVLLTVASTLLDRYLTDLRGFAAATMEGLVILRGGTIVEANAQFAAIMGEPGRAESFVGRDIETLLAAADGMEVGHHRDKPVEAHPRDEEAAPAIELEEGLIGLEPEPRSFEISAREIEYRGRPATVVAVRDLTEAKAARRQIEYLARHDGLTDLPNRAMFQEQLDRALRRAERTGEAVALLALDLDRFKAVNDIFGHAEGDRVLRAVADMLRRAVRKTDTVARIGGDEFVILQTLSDQPEGARALSARILEMFRSEMDPAHDPMAVGVSIGVAMSPHDGKDAAALRHAADIALYRAKTSGKGTAAFFDKEMDIAARARRQLESDLRSALAEGQLYLAYQPLVTTREGLPTGYEALIRWDHPERGSVEPEVFVPMAEETGAIITIGEWVLRRACRDAARWAEPLRLAVNVSPVQLQVANFEHTVLAALRSAGLPPERLELEVTETALMKNRDETLRVLLALKRHGVRIVMDDFGTGYSSLSNLQSFPFDKIKIDRSFVANMASDEAARSIVRAIVGIGRSLSMPVVAEGIETEAQRQQVLDEGCLHAQGFLYGQPVEFPEETFADSSEGKAA